ncbi:hypothetical protein AALO_G00112420 [Alosa alosa]|uniref:Uncharacterized protein n=1 Tax=Alosa alosa TaxID=278164 RepID=A0AAV6GPA2_9TELE|nr:hypothetical protein AALO_G00112420 [Alosa alosa]
MPVRTSCAKSLSAREHCHLGLSPLQPNPRLTDPCIVHQALHLLILCYVVYGGEVSELLSAVLLSFCPVLLFLHHMELTWHRGGETAQTCDKRGVHPPSPKNTHTHITDSMDSI